MRLQYLRVKQELLCKYKCFVDCGCDQLMEVFALLHSLDANERELLRFELCPVCPTPGPAVPGPGGVNPAPAPPSTSDCRSRFRAAFCGAERRGRAALLLGLLRGLKVATGDLLEPSISYVITGLEKYAIWCADQENASDADFQATLGAFCVIHDLIMNSNTSTFWIVAGPAGAAILAAMRSFIPQDASIQVLLECCATVALPTGIMTPSIPGTTSPPGQLPGPVDPGTVAAIPLPPRPVLTAINNIVQAQQAPQRIQLGQQRLTATVMAQSSGQPRTMAQAASLLRIRNM